MTSNRIEVGDQVGMLRVVGESKYRDGRRMLAVKCECGTAALMMETNLKRPTNTPKSCGCAKVKHGLWRTKAYESWSGMMSRCYKPHDISFQNYGARGIAVCERWHDFANFYADMGDRPAGVSLDRIDVDGNYEPGNCRWATAKEQGRNTRVNRLISLDGQMKPVTQWAEEVGVPAYVVFARLNLGWPPERAVRHPVRKLSLRAVSA